MDHISIYGVCVCAHCGLPIQCHFVWNAVDCCVLLFRLTVSFLSVFGICTQNLVDVLVELANISLISEYKSRHIQTQISNHQCASFYRLLICRCWRFILILFQCLDALHDLELMSNFVDSDSFQFTLRH